MSYSLFRTVSFGASKTGLATVGYQLFNADGTVNGGRVSAGVLELGGGQYSALVTLPDAFQGFIKWDTGESTPVYASEEINPPVSAAGPDPLLSFVPGTYPSGTAGHALGRLGSGQITTISPVARDGSLTIVRGDDYHAADGRALDFADASAQWPDLTGAVITFRARYGSHLFDKAGSVLVASGANKKIRVELARQQTDALIIGSAPYRFDIEATLASGRVVTLLRGTMTVLEDQRA